MAAYVWFVEMAGGRVVPIDISGELTDNEILSLVSKLNGILLPGGGETI